MTRQAFLGRDAGLRRWPRRTRLCERGQESQEEIDMVKLFFWMRFAMERLS
jgi:hypothetical protein